MPELPEVETVCRSLRPHLLGRRIEKIKVYEPRLRVRVDERALARLRGQRIEAITRRAKYILISLTDGRHWIFHLGMSGKLICVTDNLARQKHDHIVVQLDDGSELRYHDPRRFGLSLVAAEPELETLPQFRQLGVDPFGAQLTPAFLFEHTRKSERRMRDLLLDQQIVAGLGNIYANEVLAIVGVKPTRRACRLTKREVADVARTIPELLGDAIRWCGTSFSDYRDADDKSGEFQNHLRVYDRHGEPCRQCASKIKRVTLGNRSAFYCPSCQR
ncbi:MAG: bifunctional DNA-formamidopyrimidine glycosylase/DNA-(apurinic or apyrimidinic site) lyase [Deltaproteobacteria bacterium]|nr:bifunctional DNA-formamidopyrimidine glycosylase/DNA-(apurinic or apyrimidinic site) lyase [Deltaproteobacteria bacterium]